ncbi:hypothetical protein C7I87_28125 [Mesorhizobium sp. SARCC-RB16n]|uniref:hypothetical protein n=1 Tax=Mesorhizobium sp. SARCC-RB16n TaxID=2116687 RepID=UPI00122FB07F|nr:hypothetical protein [Mesorhizobium sp. SARCC-RB16n]KAA3447127.1 hypothetical protein C7I87_28125 [Mesorhizobium sp. SARCC-RB16n]
MGTEKQYETPEALFERVSLRLRTVGLESAVEALINVCVDKGSPPPAKATAGVALLRANGMLVDKAGSGKKVKDPSEMTGDELQDAIDRLKRDARAASALPTQGSVQAPEKIERGAPCAFD